MDTNWNNFANFHSNMLKNSYTAKIKEQNDEELLFEEEGVHVHAKILKEETGTFRQISSIRDAVLISSYENNELVEYLCLFSLNNVTFALVAAKDTYTLTLVKNMPNDHTILLEPDKKGRDQILETLDAFKGWLLETSAFRLPVLTGALKHSGFLSNIVR